MTSLPQAVLFDMDGTLVDTEPYWMRAESELVHAYGGTWTHDDGLSLVGNGLEVSAAVLQARGVDLDIPTVIDRLTDKVTEQLAEAGVPWRPGAQELLRSVREAGIKTALVTMSYRRMAEQIASYIPFDPFDAIVAGDMVEHPKPHPEAYLEAARRLGVDPTRSVAFEDSLGGLAAAVAAGTIAVGVPHLVPLPETGEHTLWPTLEGRSVADVRELAEAKAGAA
ncbi:HAD family hydrolase [Gryllotalpicola ginsengisoli]|uniref:HAD family hydrolase n=1 Tax=Gryllotalpicola ginsengisoli TaxID=444608 RepID=UPI0003B5F4AB|nr:HAD family hydrolase [Gryllotalpicola ginsengisoli]